MGIALNTPGVSASVDDGGQIVRWFDKEAALSVLAGSWFEIFNESGRPVVWELDDAAINAPKYEWRTGGAAATKTVTALSRALQVEVRGGLVPLVSVVDLQVGNDDQVDEMESGLVVRRPRLVIEAESTVTTWSAETTPSGLRLKVPVDDEATVTVSVTDRTDRR